MLNRSFMNMSRSIISEDACWASCISSMFIFQTKIPILYYTVHVLPDIVRKNGLRHTNFFWMYQTHNIFYSMYKNSILVPWISSFPCRNHSNTNSAHEPAYFYIWKIYWAHVTLQPSRGQTDSQKMWYKGQIIISIGVSKWFSLFTAAWESNGKWGIYWWKCKFFKAWQKHTLEITLQYAAQLE